MSKYHDPYFDLPNVHEDEDDGQEAYEIEQHERLKPLVLVAEGKQIKSLREIESERAALVEDKDAA